jgi:hypothetical protein
MTDTLDAVDADRVLKAKHRARWALGDCRAVAGDLIAELGAVLVDAAGVRRRDRVLAGAAGGGNVAVPAALAAEVVASVLTPELVPDRHPAVPGVPR